MENRFDIMVVDDDECSREITSATIEILTGQEVDKAINGYEALEKVMDTSKKYSHIFMDILMDGMNGIETTKLIRELVKDNVIKTDVLKIIGLSSSMDLGVISDGINNGFDEYLIKPINNEDISRIFHKH